MVSRDYRDFIGGLALLVLGFGLAWYATNNYAMGSLWRMGPGAFPAGVGVCLGVLGLVHTLTAFARTGARSEIRIRTPIFILASIAAFALIVTRWGLIPAVLAVVVISSFAELKIRPVSLAILSVVVCLMIWLIFGVGLRVNIPMFR